MNTPIAIAPARRHLRFGLRTLFILITLASAVSAGAAWLWFTLDPPDPLYHRLLEVERRLAEFPTRLGAWSAAGSRDFPFPAESRFLTFSQLYKHALTGEELRMVFMAAHPKDAVRFTYVDGCDVEHEAIPMEVEFDKPPKRATLGAWVTKAMPQRWIGFWTVTRDGEWIAPQSIRREFMRDKIVYRLFLVAERAGSVDPVQELKESEVLVRDLAEHLFPELHRLLFRSEVQ